MTRTASPEPLVSRRSLVRSAAMAVGLTDLMMGSGMIALAMLALHLLSFIQGRQP